MPVPMPTLPESAYALTFDGPDAYEQLMVELLNRARTDPIEEVDLAGDAIAPGLSSEAVQPLAVVGPLEFAAQGHSNDMLDDGFFSHTNPNTGTSPFDRMRDEGYFYKSAGENISWISLDAYTASMVVRHHENLWESDGHQANILRGSFSEIGIGYSSGPGGNYLTQKFGDRGQSSLTGVVIDDLDEDAFYDVGEGLGGVQITAWNKNHTVATSTWDAGGYTLHLEPGTYTVRFEGGALDGTYETKVKIGSENVKLDVLNKVDTVPNPQKVPAPKPPSEDKPSKGGSSNDGLVPDKSDKSDKTDPESGSMQNDGATPPQKDPAQKPTAPIVPTPGKEGSDATAKAQPSPSEPAAPSDAPLTAPPIVTPKPGTPPEAQAGDADTPTKTPQTADNGAPPQAETREVGTNGADRFEGSANGDTFRALGGHDRLWGNGGDDNFWGNGGKDQLRMGTGDDTAYGNGKADGLAGQGGHDNLFGGNGRDTLKGGGGNDTLKGGNGSDKLVGGRGDDTLSGNGGADTFIISKNHGNDVVTDFEPGTDALSLRKMGAAFDLSEATLVVDDGVLITHRSGTILLEGVNTPDDLLIA